MKSSSTGVRRLRAGLPADWTAGDKTGTGARGSVNDVLIAFPPNRQPLVAAVYMSDSTLPTPSLEEAHKDIGACIGLA
jgi:beta-lactamase class A